MKKFFAASVLAAFMPFVANAAGVPASTSFQVSLTILSTCSVATPTAVNLGSPISTSTQAAVGSTDIKVTCSKNTPYSIALAPTGSAINGKGTLNGPNSETIAYGLYTSATYGTPWGKDANSFTGTPSTTGAEASYPVYVQVLGTDITNKAPGTYTDTVTVSVNY